MSGSNRGMEKKRSTVSLMKEQREVPAGLREHLREQRRIRKAILGALKHLPLTVPEIADKTGLPKDVVLYHLMSLRKFGEVETDRPDDMDEYYYYRIKEGAKGAAVVAPSE